MVSTYLTDFDRMVSRIRFISLNRSQDFLIGFNVDNFIRVIDLEIAIECRLCTLQILVLE